MIIHINSPRWQKKNQEFDFIFADADKPNYLNFLERFLKLVKVGGIIAFDNTLWFSFVVEEEESVPEFMRESRAALIEFNKKLALDPRVEISQISVGDGVTLCRRLVWAKDYLNIYIFFLIIDYLNIKTKVRNKTVRCFNNYLSSFVFLIWNLVVIVCLIDDHPTSSSHNQFLN